MRGHYEYALSLAARYLAKSPPHADRGQIEGAALEGLCRAAKSYDPLRGVPFKNWAARRIIGQIHDDLRTTDHLTRTMRKKAQRQARGEMPDPQAKALLDGPVSLSQVATDGGMTCWTDMVADPSMDDAFNVLFTRISRTELRLMMEQLSPREKMVVALRFYEDMRLWQIAYALGISESRASQVEAKALKSMRVHLEERGLM